MSAFYSSYAGATSSDESTSAVSSSPDNAVTDMVTFADHDGSIQTMYVHAWPYL